MAAKNPVMRVTLTGDADGAVKALRAVANELARTDARYKATADAISREADRIASKAESTAARVQASSNASPSRSQVVGGNARSSAFGAIDNAVGSVPGGDMLSQLGGAEALLGGISTKALAASAGVAAIGTAAVIAGQKSVAAFQDIGGQVQQFAFLTGQSAEAASGWVGALNASGVGVDQWVDRVRQFQTNLAQSEERFTKAGVSIRKFSDGTTDATSTMWAAIQQMHDMPDMIERQRVGFQLFGESWTQLRALIDDPDAFTALRAQFDGSFTQENLDDLKAYNLAVGEFKTQVTIASAEIGAQLVPALSASMGALEEATTRAKEYGEALLDVVPGDMGLKDVALAIPGVSQAVVAVELLNSAHKDREEKAKAAAVEEQRLADAAQQEAAAASAAAIANAKLANEMAALGFSAQSTASILRDVASASSEAFSSMVAAQRSSVDIHDRYVDAMASVDQITQQAAQTAVDSSEKIQSATDGVVSAQEAAGKAAEAVGKAERDGAKQIAEAQEQIVEAIAGREEAQRDLAQTIEDVNRDIARFERDSAETIVEAQQKVMDAREKAAEQAIDGARKIEDAQHDLQQAQLAALTNDNPFEVQDNIAEAVRKLGRVRDDVARDAEDAAQDVGDANKDLARTERQIFEDREELARTSSEKVVSAQDRVTESTKAIGKAQEALAETQESVAERVAAASAAAATAADGVATAQRNLDKAYADANTTVANTIVTDGEKERKLREIIQATYDEVQAAKDRGASEEEIQKILDTSKGKVDALGAAWKIPQEKIDAYQATLLLIPTEINTNVVLKMTTDQFATALRNASLDLVDLNSQANAALGGEMVGGTMPVPDFRTGRAIGGTVYPGITYAVNEMGRETLTLGTGVGPGYVNSAGSNGGGITINMNAPFYGDERRLAEEIAKAARRGNG